ncbi:DNA translocase FtsK 4TM domain-containing protein, partial [uncultured Lentibacter sp.]
MAYQTRGRDPLLDSNMAEAIEKRGKELLGIALVVAALAAAAMFLSYNPNDPSWLSATDAPVQNWMGSIGAAIAAPLFMIVGWGGFGIAVALLAWGARFALHFGADRAVSRLVFAPIWLAILSIYASTLVPGESWTHSFGLGGLFGDTVLGSLLGLLPVGASFGLKLLSLVLGAVVVSVGLFVLGFTRPELRYIARFLLIGTIMTYATGMKLLGKTASGAVAAAQTMQERNRLRRDQRALARAEAAELVAMEDAQSLEVEAYPQPSFAP